MGLQARKSFLNYGLTAVLLATVFSCPFTAFGAFPLISTKTVAGSGGGADSAYALARDASGNLFVAGSLTQAAGGLDIWLAKYDANFVLLSTYTYDKAGFADEAWGVALDTASGNVFAAGYVSSGPTTSSRDIWLGKFDANLLLVATTTFNGSAGDDDAVMGLRLDGGSLYAVGRSSHNQSAGQWVARYDRNLVLLSSSILAQVTPVTLDLLPTTGGVVFAAGSRAPNPATSNDAWVGKYDANLVLITSAALNGPTANSDEYRRLLDDGAGGVYAVGYLYTGTLADRFIAHYDSNLVLISSSLANGAGNADEYLTDVRRADNGNLLVAGDSSEAVGQGGRNAFVAEYTPGLALVSSASYRSGAAGEDHAYSILLAGGELIAVGWADVAGGQDAWLARISTAGALGAPTAPTAFTGAAQSTSSILWSWTDASNNEAGFRVMSGTISISGDLAAGATSWLQFGLGADLVYGPYAAQAYNSSTTSNSGTASRYTLASAPAALAEATVGSSSATLFWSGTATSFGVERSTGAVFVQVGTSASAGYADLGLSAASTYYYRVRAFNGDALATAYASSLTIVTSPLEVAPSAPTGFTGTAVSTYSILWSWTDASSNEDGFRVVSGTISISTDLAQGATNWLQTGLAANAAYGPYAAQAYNSSATANSSAVSRYTFAAVPGTPAFTTVYQSSVTVSWSASGNPGVTVYALERSTGTGYGSHFTGSATYYFDQFLVPAATHTYRVRALNGDGLSSAYSATATAVALPPPALPGSAGTPVGVALGVSSISWTWVLASGATYHQLFRPADNSLLGASVAGPFVLSALTPNTAYGLRVAGANLGGIGPLSPSATVYTSAATPTGATASSATATTLAISWGLGGNPVATVAQLDRSTNAIAYSSLTAAAVTAHADSGLLACTTYYYRVRSLNGDGLATPYSLFQGVTANLTPTPPSGLTASANAGGTVSLAWAASPSEGVTGYRLYTDAGTGSVFYGAPLAVLSSTASAYTTGVLSSSAAYIFVLRAVHRCGVEESAGAIAMSGAAAAPPVVRAIIKEPDSGKRVRGNRLTLLGELIQGSRSECRQIDFQYKEAAASTWTSVAAANINHANPDFAFPYFTHADANSLPPGFYDLRAVAYDRSGVADPAPPAVRLEVVMSGADIDENDDNGRVRKNQTINNGVTSTVDTAGGDASAPVVRVLIPAGAVTASTATVTVVANPAISTAAPRGQSLVGSAIKIDLSNGQTALNANADLTLTYPDSIVFPSLLQIYYLNEATGQWTRDFTSTVDTTSRTVTGQTPHFSTFALMLGNALAGDLSDVRVYPVPYKPNGGNPDEGRPFSSTDQNSGIIFANLAPATTIKIFTMTGRQVSMIENVSVAGTIRWDAKNQDGREVVSGVYFAVIAAPGNKPVVRKMVIVR